MPSCALSVTSDLSVGWQFLFGWLFAITTGMDRKNVVDSRPLWISHRGYKHNLGENTRAAFDRAVELGFPAIETDLRVTLDGHIVLYHDENLRKFGDRKTSIEDLTRQEVEQRLRFPCGNTPMFIDEFIERYQACRWCFDMKRESADRATEILKRYNHSLIENNTIFLCRTMRQERVLRTFYPRAKFFAQKIECYLIGVAFLLGGEPLIPFNESKIYSVSPRFCGKSLFTSKVFASYQEKGAQVLAYLPDPLQARKAVTAGVDMVLTDGMIPSDLHR